MPMNPIDLNGRLAVVTGAGSGIGRALAVEAVQRGMTVALADIDEPGVQATLALVGQGIAHHVDIRDPDALARFAETAIDRFGPPAVVFANAGIIKYESSLRPDLTSWRRVVDINLIGAVNTVDAFLGRMIDRGEPGQFVLTGSMGSFVAAPEIASYVACKHAVWALAQCLRLELGEASAVGISLLAPPRVDTPLLNESVARTRAARGDEAASALRGGAMMPAEIASAALDGARDRRFYIAPRIEEVAPIVRQRIDELLGGQPEEWQRGAR